MMNVMITKMIKKWKKLFWPGPVCGCKFFIIIVNHPTKWIIFRGWVELPKGISNCTPIPLDSHDIPIVIFPRYSSYGWFDWHISWHAKELPIEAEVQPESHWRFLGKWPDLVSNIDDWTKRYTATYRPYNNNCVYIGYIHIYNIYIRIQVICSSIHIISDCICW
jgi:hypothetical protein